MASSSSASRASTVLARLEARHRVRALEAQKVKSQTSTQKAPEEDSDAFLSLFTQIQKETTQNMQTCAVACSSGEPEAQSKLANEIAETLVTCNRMRAMTASATYYLTSFDVRACEAQSNALRDLAHALRAKHLPRRRFKFSQDFSRQGYAGALEHVLESASDTSTANGDDARTARPADIGGREAALENFDGGKTQVIDVDVSGLDATIRDGRDAVVVCRGRATALRLARLTNCVVLCAGEMGSVDGPVYVEECTQGAVAVDSRQLRIHDSQGVAFYVAVSSTPIMEDSSNLKFAPWRDEDGTGDVHVQDFNRVLRDDGMGTCNWSTIDATSRVLTGLNTEEAVLSAARGLLCT
ncbi:tubulin-specific chaperone C [Pseudoscourfieldia marina]